MTRSTLATPLASFTPLPPFHKPFTHSVKGLYKDSNEKHFKPCPDTTCYESLLQIFAKENETTNTGITPTDLHGKPFREKPQEAGKALNLIQEAKGITIQNKPPSNL